MDIDLRCEEMRSCESAPRKRSSARDDLFDLFETLECLFLYILDGDLRLLLLVGRLGCTLQISGEKDYPTRRVQYSQ